MTHDTSFEYAEGESSTVMVSSFEPIFGVVA